MNFRPVMRAGWLAYIHSVYGAEGVPDIGDIEGFGGRWLSLCRCWMLRSSAVMDDAIGQQSVMNSNPKSVFWLKNNAYNRKKKSQ